MITIPKNNYAQPTEVREEVVQAICEAFISGKSYHPFRGRGNRDADHYVVVGFSHPFFSSNTFSSRENYLIRGVEMKRAFEELIKAGYYMFHFYESGVWPGYKCSKAPFLEKGPIENGTPVQSFEDRID